jgi:hypothetical protein
MRLKPTSISAVVVLAALFSSAGGLAPAAAQSLADVARQEQERRKAIKDTAKVLTNKDLGAVPAPAEPATAAPAADGATPAGAGSDAAKTDPATGDPAKPEPAKDQAYWSGRWKDLQTQLTRNGTFEVALQSRINALSNDYTNEGDGVRQLAIAADRQKAIDELDRLRKETQDLEIAIVALQEEARLARVPPGWLR